MDIRFESQEKAVNAAIAASDRAVNKAEIASEKRFDAVNEFRAALSDSARLLMPRAESEQIIKVLSSKIESLEARVNSRDDERRGSGQTWLLIAAIFAVLANVLVTFFYISRIHS